MKATDQANGRLDCQVISAGRLTISIARRDNGAVAAAKCASRSMFPFAGALMLRGLLAIDGSKVGRRHAKTLMRRMGIEAFGAKAFGRLIQDQANGHLVIDENAWRSAGSASLRPQVPNRMVADEDCPVWALWTLRHQPV